MDERLLILLDIDELLNDTVEIEVDEDVVDEQAGAA